MHGADGQIAAVETPRTAVATAAAASGTPARSREYLEDVVLLPSVAHQADKTGSWRASGREVRVEGRRGGSEREVGIGWVSSGGGGDNGRRATGDSNVNGGGRRDAYILFLEHPSWELFALCLILVLESGCVRTGRTDP